MPPQAGIAAQVGDEIDPERLKRTHVVAGAAATPPTPPAFAVVLIVPASSPARSGVSSRSGLLLSMKHAAKQLGCRNEAVPRCISAGEVVTATAEINVRCDVHRSDHVDGIGSGGRIELDYKDVGAACSSTRQGQPVVRDMVVDRRATRGEATGAAIKRRRKPNGTALVVSAVIIRQRPILVQLKRGTGPAPEFVTTA